MNGSSINKIGMAKQSNGFDAKEVTFKKAINKLFDTAYVNTVTKIKIKEDNQFLMALRGFVWVQLHVVNEHRRQFPDAKKATLLKNLR